MGELDASHVSTYGATPKSRAYANWVGHSSIHVLESQSLFDVARPLQAQARERPSPVNAIAERLPITGTSFDLVLRGQREPLLLSRVIRIFTWQGVMPQELLFRQIPEEELQIRITFHTDVCARPASS